MGKRNEKVFELLESQNKKYKDLADAIGVSKSAITYWKKNGTDPTYEQCMKLAPLLGVSVEYLWNDDTPDEDNKSGDEVFKIDLNKLQGDKKQFAENLINIYLAGVYSDEETFNLIRKGLDADLDMVMALINKSKRRD